MSTGINDLANDWRAQAYGGVPEEYASRGLHEKYLRGDNEDAGYDGAADDLDEVARTAWHPVSEPPTEADADDWGFVAFLTDEGFVVTEPYWEAPGTACMWARIRDVVLLPQSTGEG